MIILIVPYFERLGDSIFQFNTVGEAENYVRTNNVQRYYIKTDVPSVLGTNLMIKAFHNFIRNESKSPTVTYVHTDGGADNLKKDISGYACMINSPDGNQMGIGSIRKVGTEHLVYAEIYPGGIPSCTNNYAELAAIDLALNKLLQMKLIKTKTIRILTDSEYSHKSLTEWIVNWKRNGWKNAKGKPVKNAEIIRVINEKLQRLHIPCTFEHVSAHTGDPENELVDALASYAKFAKY